MSEEEVPDLAQPNTHTQGCLSRAGEPLTLIKAGTTNGRTQSTFRIAPAMRKTEESKLPQQAWAVIALEILEPNILHPGELLEINLIL